MVFDSAEQLPKTHLTIRIQLIEGEAAQEEQKDNIQIFSSVAIVDPFCWLCNKVVITDLLGLTILPSWTICFCMWILIIRTTWLLLPTAFWMIWLSVQLFMMPKKVRDTPISCGQASSQTNIINCFSSDSSWRCKELPGCCPSLFTGFFLLIL